MRSTHWPAAAVLVVAAALTALASAPPAARPDQTEREQEFAELLTGAALVGNFTVDGQAADKPLKPERYEISKARKVEGDTWEITARIKYGEVDLQVPIQLDVLWAGDTPVMSLTDLRIPLMEGSFTARVLFYGDRYVGTWQHGKVGGHMFGHVERAGEEKPGAENAGGQTVSGTITLDGLPLSQAAVEFAPTGRKGTRIKGETDERGQFKLKAPPGEYQVRIRSAENDEQVRRVPGRYREASPLRATVIEGRNEFDFRLESP